MGRITPREVRSSLTRRQQAVLVGTLLGDGCLAKHGNYHRLHVKHAIAQRALVEFKYEAFRDFISMRLHEFDQKLLRRTFGCIQFATKTHPLFSGWHERFYRDGRKRVPVDVDCYLDPLAVAVWFMDDGAADHAGVTFQTHNFDPVEVDLLREALRERFRLETTRRENKGRTIIYIGSRQMPRFEEIVGEFLLDDLSYKLRPSGRRTP